MLTELGFHKTAGAQADAYRAIKPAVLDMLNIRNKADMRVMESTMERLSKLPGRTDPLEPGVGRGPFSTLSHSALRNDDRPPKIVEQLEDQMSVNRRNGRFSARYKDEIRQKVLEKAFNKGGKPRKLNPKDLW